MLTSWKRQASHLKRETYVLYLAYRDARTPWYAKFFLAAVVAYALSPIDLIPDAIPVLGFLDDLVILPLGVALSLRMIPPAVLSDCRERAETAMLEGNPNSWKAALAVIAVWLLAAGVSLYALARLLQR
jgi:uncharacterized membrane protein YkvA (DUF1232 family)